ncbi:MAG TPA: hypothetical protein P5128_08950, partial [Candidatus Sumerlaeia bacterium]|nr:hypothetical protein [Candidatus Sumerlaeia bacterium]
GSGLEEFLQMIPPLLQKTKSIYHYGIPYHRFDLLAKIQAQGEDAVVEYFDEYIKLKVRMEPDIAKAISHDSDLKRL